jgi:hypothetical protein
VNIPQEVSIESEWVRLGLVQKDVVEAVFPEIERLGDKRRLSDSTETRDHRQVLDLRPLAAADEIGPQPR